MSNKRIKGNKLKRESSDSDISVNRLKKSKIKGNKIKKYDTNNKIENKVGKVKQGKVRRRTEKEIEREANYEENISIFSIVLIVVVCFIVGIALGYVLYEIAIGSSSAMIMGKMLK